MATPRAKFKQVDVTRALKGAIAAGYHDAQVKLAPDGCIFVSVGKAASQVENKNPWDEVIE